MKGNNNYTIYDNFEKALATLNRFLSYDIVNDRDRAGIIQGFEFTFECCWKTLQKLAKLENFEVKSPRESIIKGMELGVFDFSDEEILIKMMLDRNLTSHIYEESMSIEICNRIQNQYYPLLEKCLTNIKEFIK